MKKTNYRKNLEKEFKGKELTSIKIFKEDPETGRLVEHKESNVYKLSESPKYEFITYSSGEVLKARQDTKKLDKMLEKRVKAFDFQDKNGKTINVYIPQRLQFLNEEPSGQ
jgi:hypothetical protein